MGARASSTNTALRTLDIKEGFYRVSADSTVVLECYQKDACVGGTNQGKYCAVGYEGPCESNHSDICMCEAARVATLRKTEQTVISPKLPNAPCYENKTKDVYVRRRPVDIAAAVKADKQVRGTALSPMPITLNQ